MTKIIQQQSSRGGVGKQFVYLLNLVVYLNDLDMNESSAMPQEMKYE